MNIVKLQNDLKDLSDRQLMDTMQAGSAPQYLVLSEMQRRKKMRSEAQSQPQQPTSVAEEIMQPSQGIAAMPQNPMVQMYGGGIVGFASGKKVSGYQKGASEACYTDPMTGKSLCPPDKPKMVGKKFATGKMVKEIESGGRQYDAEGNVLTSPKGAKGVMQIMPTTAMDPGYGARNIFQLADDLGVDYGGKKDIDTAVMLLGNEMLNQAMGDEYLAAMERRFGSDDAAMAAYNAGPGRVGRSGFDESGDRGVLPEETQDYLAKADKLRAEVVASEPVPLAEGIEQILPTQTGAEAIAALGEGKTALEGMETFNTEELKAIRGKENVDWSKIPPTSVARNIYGTDAETVDDVNAETLLYDQGGAYDVSDWIGSPMAGGSSVWPNRAALPDIAEDKGLMALAPKTPYGRPRGLLEGEKIVNAAERATAEDYEEMPANKEYGGVVATGPSDDIPNGIKALVAQPTDEGPGFDDGDTGVMPPIGVYEASAMAAEDPAEKERLMGIHRQWQSGVDVPVEGESGWRYSAEGDVYFNPQGQLASPPVEQFAGTTKSRFEKKAAAEHAKTVEKQTADAQNKVNAFLQEQASAGGGEAASDPLTDLYNEIKAERAKEYKPNLNELMMRTGLGMMASKRGSFLGALGEGGVQGLDALAKDKAAAQKARQESLSDMVKLIGSRELSAAKAATAARQQSESYLKGIEGLKKQLEAGAFESEAERKVILDNIKKLTQLYNMSVGLPIASTGTDPSSFKSLPQ